MTIARSRRTALSILADIRRRGAFSRPVVDASLKESGLSREDSAFASRLVYGVITAEGTLDALIDGFAKRPGAVEPRVRDVLRMSICELLYLSTPPRAAVHQGVDAVRQVRPAAAGFANAVLRQIAEKATAFPWGDIRSDRDALARASAMPRWLVDVFLEDLGDEAGVAALLAGVEPPPMYVRVNPFRADRETAIRQLTEDGADPQPSPPDPGCIHCASARGAVHGEAVSSGMVIVSDAAAQVAPLAADPSAGSMILDIGAGRGTKTATLQGVALSAGGAADITAVDIHGFKLDMLAKTLAGLGIPAAQMAIVDATDGEAMSALGDRFDIVLLDAPCSGLGTLRRHPEKRWRIMPEDVDRMARLQYSMLEAACLVVRPGGVVVYSTCTIARAENQGVIESLLQSDRGQAFSVRPIEGVVDEEWGRFITPEGYFRSWPEHDGADGHFVAVLERQ